MFIVETVANRNKLRQERHVFKPDRVAGGKAEVDESPPCRSYGACRTVRHVWL